MIERILGIDLGIASLGWAVIEYDTEKGTYKIIDCGVRLFSKGINNDDESPAKNRREKRLTRKRLKRVSIRKENVRQLCIKYGLASAEELNGENFAQGIFHEVKKKDVWELRYDALHRKLSDKEFARVLLHLSAHRGFKFLPYEIEDEAKDHEDKTDTEKKASLLMERVKNKDCRTIGEYRWQIAQHHGLKRFNKKKNDDIQKLKKSEQPSELLDWQLIARRDDVLAEAKVIFDIQRQLGNEKATIELENEYTGKETNGQLMWVADPQSVEDMVGYCKYFPSEKRSPKYSPTSEKFVALSTLINCRIIDWATNQEIKATDLQSINNLLEFIYQREETTYKQLRDFLNLKNYQTFKGLHYDNNLKKKKSKKSVQSAVLIDEQNQLESLFPDKTIEEKRFVSKLKGTKKLQNTLGDYYDQLNIEAINQIAFICSVEKTQEARKKQLFTALKNDELAEKCKFIEFSGFIELSLTALNMIMPEMLNGNRYDEAIAQIGMPSKQKDKWIPTIKQYGGRHAQPRVRILNPAVLRALSEFRKVANALVRKYGTKEDDFAPFHRVYFELPRDFKTIEEKEREKEKNSYNKSKNDEIDKILQQDHDISSPKRKHREAYKLWEQQGEVCIYCQAQLEYEKVFAVEGYAEIDHILPRSRSFDNSFQNKILVHATCNQTKRDKTPFEWLSDENPQQWERLKNFLASPTLKQKIGSRKINNILKDNFSDEQSIREFSERNLNDTSYICKAVKDFCEEYWQLAPLPRNGNKTPRQIAVRNGRLTSFLRYQWGISSIENKKDRIVHTHHAEDAIIVALSTEGMVNKLAQYYRDKETLPKNKAPKIPEPITNIRAEIASKLAIEKAETISAKDGREITLNRILISRPPRASVTGAAHKETIQSPSDYKGRGVSINDGKGMCDNGDMPRVDVFTKEGKYYLVPIYVADFAKEELPNRAIVAGKGKEWKEMDDSYQFLFSLAKDDILRIKLKKDEPFIGYFKSADSSTANIKLQYIEQDVQLNFGSKTAEYIKKYTIDPLGYYHEVKGKKRLGTIPQEAKKRRIIKKS